MLAFLNAACLRGSWAEVSDHSGFKHFDHECNTMLPITEVSDASSREVKVKVHALAAPGKTRFFSAIQ